MVFSEKLIAHIVHIAVEAGKAILSVYNKDFEVDYKDDSSPITDADRLSHAVLAEGLSSLLPSLPVISEEGHLPSPEICQNLSEYWLIDPLDGTKEFVKKNGEFTINIALVRCSLQDDSKPLFLPVFGLVYAPAIDEAYLGWVYDDEPDGIMPGQAYRLKNVSQADGYWRESAHELVPIKRIERANMPLRVLSSRSHLNKETKDFIRSIEVEMNTIETVALGSCLKMCKIASGYAHVYPRFSPTMEWDTAAAHALCRAVGVSVINTDSCKPLEYNKKDLKNPGILVTAIPTLVDFLCVHTN